MFQHRIRFSGKKAVARSVIRVGEATIIVERDALRGEIKVMIDASRSVRIEVQDVGADYDAGPADHRQTAFLRRCHPI